MADSEPDDTELVHRAFAAYWRSDGSTADIPANDSYATEHEGLRYVVLQNVNGVLAVYRYRNQGILRRLRRWPRAVEAGVYMPSEGDGPLVRARRNTI
jgi:hypothetical protein